MNYTGIPHHMRNATKMYVEHGILHGGFLRAVFENNLVESFSIADDINLEHMFDWACWLYMECPANIRGSAKKVDAWIEYNETNRNQSL